MRKLLLLTMMFSPLALADSLSVEPHSLLRLASKASAVHLPVSYTHLRAHET